MLRLRQIDLIFALTLLWIGCATVLILANLQGQRLWMGAAAFLLGGVIASLWLRKCTGGAADLGADAKAAVPLQAAPAALDQISQDEISQKVQVLFDRLPIAMLEIDASGHVKQSNVAAREFLRLAPGEQPKFDSLVEGLGRSVASWLRTAMDNHILAKPEMVQVVRGQGDAVLQVTLMPPPVEGQGGLIATLSDATELKSLEAQFLQSQKMQAIGQLAGGVAHDFNNLLTAISGYCDLMLLRHEKGDPDYNDLIQINQNANRAAALVGQLLAFSRKQTLQPKPVAVNDSLSELTHLLSRLMGEKVQLMPEYGKNLPLAFVDVRQLDQVVMNLVVNARDAMPNGGEVSVISGSKVFETNTRFQGVMVPKGTYVTLSVKDQGMGIRADRIDKIFEPFYSTKDVGEGTGLGLSMAYGIIKQTGGFIFVESEVDVGSEFTILLPAFEESHKMDTPKVKRAVSNVALNGLTVMLVEDEAPVRTFAARALAMQGVYVVEAASAESALEQLQDPDLLIDVIVSDVVMPGMDGPTWVREALKSRPDVQVIFVSGYAQESFSHDHSDIPDAHFLPKPFSLKQLIQKVRDLSVEAQDRAA